MSHELLLNCLRLKWMMLSDLANFLIYLEGLAYGTVYFIDWSHGLNHGVEYCNLAFLEWNHGGKL